MLRGAAMLIDETLNFLKARDDAFLTRGASALLSGWRNREFVAQFSRSRSLIAALILEAHEGGCAFGQQLFPGVGRAD